MIIHRPAAESFRHPEPVAAAARPSTLNGVRVGLIDNGFAALIPIHQHILRRLCEQGAESGSVVSKKYWLALSLEDVDALTTEADVVLTGLCATPPSTYATANDCVALEGRHIPTLSFVVGPYLSLFEMACRVSGGPDLYKIVLPFPLGDDTVRLTDLADRAVDFAANALTGLADSSTWRLDRT